MKKFILILILLVALFIFFTQKYAVRTGRQPDGNYSVVLVDKKSGELTIVMGD